MNLDDLLGQPLEPIRDNGFSARVALAMRRERQRRQTWLRCLGAAALLPVIALLPLAQAGDILARSLAAAPFQNYLALAAGLAILAWALRPRPYRL